MKRDAGGSHVSALARTDMTWSDGLDAQNLREDQG